MVTHFVKLLITITLLPSLSTLKDAVERNADDITPHNAVDIIPHEEYHLSPTMRYALITWSVLSTILSLSGNTLVLVSSLKYSAIKLDKISVVMMRNIAVADLGHTVVVILPTIGSLAADRMIYGHGMCFVLAYTAYVFSIANAFLIAALNCNKLCCLLFPLRARLATMATGRKIVSVLWVVTVCYLLENIVLKRPVIFEPIIDRCNPDKTDSYWQLVDRINSVVFALIPLVVILTSTAWLLCYVKSRGILRSHNLTLILSVSIVYMVSLGPFIVYQNQPHRLPELYAFSVYVNYVSTIANPFLYYWSSASFKEFVDQRIPFGKLKLRWKCCGLKSRSCLREWEDTSQVRYTHSGSRRNAVAGEPDTEVSICFSSL